MHNFTVSIINNGYMSGATNCIYTIYLLYKKTHHICSPPRHSRWFAHVAYYHQHRTQSLSNFLNFIFNIILPNCLIAYNTFYLNTLYVKQSYTPLHVRPASRQLILCNQKNTTGKTFPFVLLVNAT
jgi:hypothetical protein